MAALFATRYTVDRMYALRFHGVRKMALEACDVQALFEYEIGQAPAEAGIDS